MNIAFNTTFLFSLLKTISLMTCCLQSLLKIHRKDSQAEDHCPNVFIHSKHLDLKRNLSNITLMLLKPHKTPLKCPYDALNLSIHPERPWNFLNLSGRASIWSLNCIRRARIFDSVLLLTTAHVLKGQHSETPLKPTWNHLKVLEFPWNLRIYLCESRNILNPHKTPSAPLKPTCNFLEIENPEAWNSPETFLNPLWETPLILVSWNLSKLF